MNWDQFGPNSIIAFKHNIAYPEIKPGWTWQFQTKCYFSWNCDFIKIVKSPLFIQLRIKIKYQLVLFFRNTISNRFLYCLYLLYTFHKQLLNACQSIYYYIFHYYDHCYSIFHLINVFSSKFGNGWLIVLVIS